MQPQEIGKYLTVDPRVCFGKLTFKGTRLPVETILYYVSTGRTLDEILMSWPELKREALAEAINLAARALSQQSGAQTEEAREPVHSGRST